MGATVIRTSGSEGASCGSASMCEWIFAGVLSTGRTTSVEREWCFLAGRYERRRGKRWFPTGRAISAEGGVAVHRGADHVELPRLARPKGCFVTSASWS